ncbi:hypothetical protein BS78_04G299900 [Paspalum vaginatum]|nr:hypothetical protein BS78_04G299900 [Paspalum vaginatum]
MWWRGAAALVPARPVAAAQRLRAACTAARSHSSCGSGTATWPHADAAAAGAGRATRLVGPRKRHGWLDSPRLYLDVRPTRGTDGRCGGRSDLLCSGGATPFVASRARARAAARKQRLTHRRQRLRGGGGEEAAP